MKAYYNQQKIASNLQYFFKKFSLSNAHMFCKDKFTILLFSLRIGKQGISL